MNCHSTAALQSSSAFSLFITSCKYITSIIFLSVAIDHVQGAKHVHGVGSEALSLSLLWAAASHGGLPSFSGSRQKAGTGPSYPRVLQNSLLFSHLLFQMKFLFRL